MSEQRSEEWFAERAGKITASRMGELRWEGRGERFKSGLRAGQLKPMSSARSDYLYEVAAEIITGQPKPSVRAKALDHGKALEEDAIAAYEASIGSLVTTCGFIVHPDYPFIGASPDFLVGDDGGAEVKCPFNPAVHLTTLLNGLPDEHVEQIQGGLLVTKRRWWDFVSFCPDFPPKYRLHVQRVEVDRREAERLRLDCLDAWAEIQAIVTKLQERM